MEDQNGAELSQGVITRLIVSLLQGPLSRHEHMRLAESSGDLLLFQTPEEAGQTMSYELAHGIACHGVENELDDNGIADGPCQAFLGWTRTLQRSTNHYATLES